MVFTVRHNNFIKNHEWSIICGNRNIKRQVQSIICESQYKETIDNHCMTVRVMIHGKKECYLCVKIQINKRGRL